MTKIIENPRVGGSIPSLTTFNNKKQALTISIARACFVVNMY